MSVSVPDKEHEEQRLALVLDEIAGQHRERTSDTAKYRAQLTGTQDFLRDESPRAVADFEGVIEVASGMQKLKTAAKLHRFSLDRARQLERLAKSPYFARIDFRSSGAGVQQIYIGISSLMAQETGKHLVFDWRAPVSSMYYDYELGHAQYEAPLGVVAGEILLKRHFRIKDGRLTFMFDNSLTIYDEMLQDALQKATGDRMRSIVNTIQREQNRVIRGDSRGALVVQGSAGSGKTVIALHRAAYLLYKHRATMVAKNIVMFSPGGLFTDYTSPVLPELGEEPVQQISFSEFGADRLRSALPGTTPAGMPTATPAAMPTAEQILSPLQIESLGDQLEYLLDDRGSKSYLVRTDGIRLKSSQEFAALIVRYAGLLTDSAEGLGEVSFRGNVVMSREEAAKLLRSEYGYLPLERRVDKIKRRANWLLDEVQEHRVEELQKEIAESAESAYLFAKEIKRMGRIQAHQEIQAARDRVHSWKPVATLEAYMKLFKDEALFSQVAGDSLALPKGFGEVRKQTLARLNSGTIPYEDLAPLLLLQGMLDGFPDSGGVRHVIVDEVQDFSPAQHEVLRRSFPGAAFTLLGDVNQSMNVDSGPATSEEVVSQVSAVYGSTDRPVVRVILTESYRSTREITEFTRGLLAGGEPIEAIERPGELPKVFVSPDREALARSVAADVAGLKDSGLTSIAIICKTARESWAAFDNLKAAPGLRGQKISLVKPGEGRFRRGILVIASYLAKGLEFEAVVIYDASKDRYSAEADRRVLYTACTRALHKLHLHYEGVPSPFVANADPALYQSIG